MAPRKTLNRLDALSSHAKASAPPALPERHVRFASQARVKEDDQASWKAPVDFGRKDKPQRAHRPSTAPSPSRPAAAAPPPEPPRSPERPQSPGSPESSKSKGGLFGRLFSSHSPKADKPTTGPLHRPAATPVSVGPGPRPQSPAQKFNDQVSDFMNNYPYHALKKKVTDRLARGEYKQLMVDLGDALNVTPDKENAERLKSMVNSLLEMKGNYENVRVLGVKSPR